MQIATIPAHDVRGLATWIAKELAWNGSGSENWIIARARREGFTGPSTAIAQAIEYGQRTDQIERVPRLNTLVATSRVSRATIGTAREDHR